MIVWVQCEKTLKEAIGLTNSMREKLIWDDCMETARRKNELCINHSSLRTDDEKFGSAFSEKENFYTFSKA